MSKLIRRNWWVILGLIVAIIAIIAITLALTHKPLKAQTPVLPTLNPLYIEIGALLPAVGDSMTPTIQDGDMLLISYSKARPKVGQIILYHDFLSGKWASHRVTTLGEDSQGWWATTKGDNNPVADLFYLRELNLIGVVKWRIQIYK